MNTTRAIISLTRWKDYVLFVFPLTILGVILATKASGTNIDYKILLILVANLLTIAYAFMINDVEDAEDDKFMECKAKRNPISNKKLSKNVGYLASLLTLLAAFSIYFYLGGKVLISGGSMLIIAHFYSSKPLRLKSWPAIDIISHALMLAGLIMLTAYLTYSSKLGTAWYLVIAVSLFSAYGQIYNQIRDYKGDKEAGLKNTTILLGKEKTAYLSYLAILLGIISIFIAVFKGIFPWWLIFVLFTALYISKRFKGKVDTIGSPTFEATGKAQLPVLIAINLVVSTWFLTLIFQQILRA